MNTITIDSNTYSEVENFAKLNITYWRSINEKSVP